jgi:hypothetical protein
LPWVVPIQVKDHIGETGSDGLLSQLREAYSYYKKDGRIMALVVMTTAEKASAWFLEHAVALSTELGVPIEVVARKKMIDLLARGLMVRLVIPPGAASEG